MKQWKKAKGLKQSYLGITYSNLLKAKLPIPVLLPSLPHLLSSPFVNLGPQQASEHAPCQLPPVEILMFERPAHCDDSAYFDLPFIRQLDELFVALVFKILRTT